MMAQVKPPRPVFVNFPLGHPCGKPHDIALQRSILTDAFQYFLTASEPGKVLDLKYEWGEPFNWDIQEEANKQMVVEEGWPMQEWVPGVSGK
jgi:hypothetical protein